MEYRVNHRTGDRVGVIGIGTSSLPCSPEAEAIATLERAYELGVNYYDHASAESSCFPLFGMAFAGVRDHVLYQVHFGAVYAEGKTYGWTTNLDKVQRSVDWQLSRLGTDRIDYGFAHCLDEAGDWRQYQDHGVWRWLLSLKEQGVVRHIGLSTHTPSTAHAVLDTGLVDMLMFSINPAYDSRQGEFAKGEVDERQALFRRCQAEGVGITVMKPFAGGQLLDRKSSPFGIALSEAQCIQYALDRPGVLAVLPGVRDRKDLARVLSWLDASEEERDYAAVSSLTPADARGRCVYCGHCKPCPSGINVSLVNKYYDLARAGDALARDHYAHLEVKASACTGCGHCDRRCPFGVEQSARMREMAAWFGE